MNVIARLTEAHAEMTRWRRDLHAHPETAFEEVRTADLVAARLQEFGLDVHRGLARTGVIGRLSTARAWPQRFRYQGDRPAGRHGRPADSRGQ